MRALALLCLAAVACGGPAANVPVEDPPDAGPVNPPPAPDAGPVAKAKPELSPTSLGFPAMVGRAPAPGFVTLTNSGDAVLVWNAPCLGATATPSGGELAPGAFVSVMISPALPEQPGRTLGSCTLAGLKLNLTVDAVAQPGVGYEGGSVDLLDFGFTGDTRPDTCDDLPHYPAETIRDEAVKMHEAGVQFALDLGDHMNSCVNIAASAKAQMDKYVAAVAEFPRPFFMTMGNHECGTAFDCTGSAGDRDNNFKTYLAALKTVSQKDLPHYFFDVQTRHGLARFVFLADNYPAQAWAEGVLADADKNAALVFIAKHHPMTGSRQGPTWSTDLVKQHKVTLVMAAHDHHYEHDTSAYAGRTLICGLGGASTANTGYCRIQQQKDGTLRFTRYDLTANPLDSWTLTP